MKQFNYENYVKNLPDFYDKTPIKQTENGEYEGSNNAKILEIERISHNVLLDDVQDVFAVLDIDNAKGKTLDLYGDMLRQPRGIATDAQYRILLKSKIMQNCCLGDYNSVLNAICKTFGCKPSEITVAELDEPCSIEITDLPLEKINNAGVTTEQAVAIINRLLPVGTKLKTFLFEGTFEFSVDETDMNIDGTAKGFTYTEEDMTNPDAVGGYLGITAGDENESMLPID